MSDYYDVCILSLKNDAATAGCLADSIRSYKLPSRVALPDPGLDFRRVLIDDREAPFDEDAGNRLDHSRFLALLCSPGTCDNPDIMAKLARFLETHGSEGVIPVMTAGEPAEIFPAGFYRKKIVQQILPDMSVTERVDIIEPVAADLRAASRSRRKEKLRYETVRIVALLLGLHPADLQQRQRRRRHRALAAAVTAVAVVSLTAAGIFLRLGFIARDEGRIAEEQARLAVEIARRTMEELPAEFAGNDMALAYVDEAAENARLKLEDLGLWDQLTAEAADAENGG